MADIRLIMSNNSIRNTTISCDSLGIQYDVSHTSGVVKVERWDASANKNVFIAEFKLLILKGDLIRFRPDDPWMLMKDFLTRDHGSRFAIAKSFTGINSVRYRWREKWSGMVLFHDSRSETDRLVAYHRKFAKGKKSYLEIKDRSVVSTLDTIIVTFLVMERKKRIKDKSSSGGGGGGG